MNHLVATEMMDAYSASRKKGPHRVPQGPRKTAKESVLTLFGFPFPRAKRTALLVGGGQCQPRKRIFSPHPFSPSPCAPHPSSPPRKPPPASLFPNNPISSASDSSSLSPPPKQKQKIQNIRNVRQDLDFGDLFLTFGLFFFAPHADLVAHDCGYPLSRYTCRS